MNRENGKSRLVVRRGQGFYINLALSRDYNASIDGISLIFSVDGVYQPLFGHGTLVAVPLLLRGEISDGPWQATIDRAEAASIRVKVRPQMCRSNVAI